MLSRKANKDSNPVTPPDINNPPSYIPLKSIDGRYQIVEELGNGSFGSVSLAKTQFELSTLNEQSNQSKQLFKDTLLNQTNMEHENYVSKSQGLVAIKTMMTRLPTLHDYTRVREVKFILSIPSNKHLIQVFEIFIDTKNYQLHIVMECMEQNLYQMMRHRRRRVFSIPSLKSILAQVLAGLRHIHDQNFFHRDIKPENILISPSTRYFDKDWLLQGNYTDNYVVKLADFGLARHVTNKNPYTAYVSTRWYRSPEILLRSGYYSRPLDIWAFGCVAVEVTIFKPLFPGSNEMDQIWKILEVLGTPHITKESQRSGYVPHGGSWEIAKDLAQRLNMKFPYVEGTGINSLISSSQLQSLTDVIKLCLRWDPNDRATAQDLCSMPFFQGTVADNSANISCTNTEQALIFAGMKSTTTVKGTPATHTHNTNDNSVSYHTRQLIFHSEGLLTNNNNGSDANSINEISHSSLIKPIHIMDESSPIKPQHTSIANSNKLSLTEFLNDEIPIIPPPSDNIADTDSTISDHQDEVDLSKEIAENIALCQVPPFENGQFIQHEEHEQTSDSIRQLANDIDAFNKQDPDLYSQYYTTTTNSHEIEVLPFVEDANYVHFNINNNAPQTNVVNSDHSSLQPVNRLLDNMSIDDSFNGSTNLNVIPRSFMLKQQIGDGNNIEFQTHHQQQQHFGNVTF